MITVHVFLFARVREIVGAPQLTVDLPDAATVADLRKELLARHSSLNHLLQRSALAVDGDLVADNHPLHGAAEVAILPPVSGGQLEEGAGNFKVGWHENRGIRDNCPGY